MGELRQNGVVSRDPVVGIGRREPHRLLDALKEVQRDLVLLRELAIADRERLRQLPRRRVQEVEGQRAGVHCRKDRRRGKPRTLPHGKQRGQVDVAFLVRVVVAMQRAELVKTVDVVVVHTRPLDELLARNRHGKSSSRFAGTCGLR